MALETIPQYVTIVHIAFDQDHSVDFNKNLDTRGLACPLPILKIKKSLAEMTSGQILKVISTDRGSVKDVQAFANQTGNVLLSSSIDGGEYIFFMQKK